jgi:general secretion pathway protein F
MAISSALRSHPLVWLAAVTAVPLVAVRWAHQGDQWHRVQLRLPLLGRLIRGLNTARLANTLGILTASGVPLLNAMRSGVGVVTNRPMKRAVEAAVREVSEGKSLANSLGRSAYFPPILVHLIASGESSGNLEIMLQRAAEAQRRELEAWVATLTALLEPLLIIARGGVVLFIVLAILSPIVQMNQLVK